MDLSIAFGRLGDARENFQERAFAGAVPPDDADHLAVFDVKRHVLESPDDIVRLVMAFR